MMTTRYITLILIFISIVFIGCRMPGQSSHKFLANTDIRYDPYTKIYIVESDDYYLDTHMFIIQGNAILRGEFNKSSSINRIDLYVITDKYSGFQSAIDINGNHLTQKMAQPTDLENRNKPL